MNTAVTITEPRPWESALWRLRALLGDPIPKPELGLFFERFAVMLASGMPAQEALRKAAQSSGPELRYLCERAAGPIAAGAPLHRAFAPWSHRLPEIVLPVLEVGEVSGTLEGAARRLADAFLKADAMERRFRYSVFDARLILLLIAFQSVVMGLSSSVWMAVERFLTVLLELSVLYLAARLLLRFLFRWAPLRLAVDTVKLAVPHMGLVARNLSAARWARSFMTLWQAGVPISHALEVSSRSALNAHYERAMLRAAQETRAGRCLSDSLAGTDMLPRYLVDMLRSGETAGNFGAVLDRFVTALEEEALTLATQELAAIVVALKILSALAVVGMVSQV
jgi:type II secretory pathway component PulF